MVSITFVGMDVHKASINVAVLEPGKNEPIEWKLDNRPTAVAKLAQRLKKDSGGDVAVCYEAGPCGFAPSANDRENPASSRITVGAVRS